MSPATRVPPRISWAVDMLDVAPDDQILELGCGPGTAVPLVCERLGDGRITAVDRSAKATDRTRAHNAGHLSAGRVVVVQADLAGFDAADDSFDKAFGVNVNVFWTTAADAEIEVLARVLRPGGVLHLVYDAPSPARARDIGPTVASRLHRHGFTTSVRPGPTSSMTAITGRLDDAPEA